MDRTHAVSAELREWVETWRKAGAALADIKRAELRRVDTQLALRQLADAFESALRTTRVTVTSGLVEQQRIFQRLRR